MGPKKNNVGSRSPIILTLGEGGVTIGGEDIGYVTDFAESLKGQTKNRFQKMLSKKSLSHDDTSVIAESLASNYTTFVRSSSKYGAATNKKAVLTRSKAIANMAKELLTEESDGDEEEEIENEETSEAGENPDDSSSDSDGRDEVEDVEVEAESEKEDTETDEELDARAASGCGGFIPVNKPALPANSGRITTNTDFLTRVYRSKEGKDNSTQVCGVGSGKLRFEYELNDDGSMKKKSNVKTQQRVDKTMYFYSGSLNDTETASNDVPLRTGIRIGDVKHLERLCTDIAVRAFSQQVFTHKDLKTEEKRAGVSSKITRWLENEVSEGITEVLTQIYTEAKDKISTEKGGTHEAKRKLQEKTDLLSSLGAKKSKK